MGWSTYASRVLLQGWGTWLPTASSHFLHTSKRPWSLFFTSLVSTKQSSLPQAPSLAGPASHRWLPDPLSTSSLFKAQDPTPWGGRPASRSWGSGFQALRGASDIPANAPCCLPIRGLGCPHSCFLLTPLGPSGQPGDGKVGSGHPCILHTRHSLSMQPEAGGRHFRGFHPRGCLSVM